MLNGVCWCRSHLLHLYTTLLPVKIPQELQTKRCNGKVAEEVQQHRTYEAVNNLAHTHTYPTHKTHAHTYTCTCAHTQHTRAHAHSFKKAKRMDTKATAHTCITHNSELLAVCSIQVHHTRLENVHDTVQQSQASIGQSSHVHWDIRSRSHFTSEQRMNAPKVLATSCCLLQWNK